MTHRQPSREQSYNQKDEPAPWDLNPEAWDKFWTDEKVVEYDYYAGQYPDVAEPTHAKVSSAPLGAVALAPLTSY